MAAPRVLAIVLAGGEGKRLMPLTADRAKPAVPFGGIYRLIDFALSNIVNSRYLRIVVLTQYKSHSLDRHIAKTWRMSHLLGNYVAPVPAQQRVGKNWYLGSADAIYQSLNLLDDEKPDIVVVVGADHVYRMDFSQMVDAHIASGAPLTVAGIRQPIELADQFGVIEADPDDPRRIKAFLEKPTDPVGLADSPREVLASMGNYVFDAEALVEAVRTDSQDPASRHDMGGDIVPSFVERGQAALYDFIENDVPGSSERDRDYWRDVGTLDAYYDANRDLIAVVPVFNLYNDDWPVFTGYTGLPPAKFVHSSPERIGLAVDSIISPGVVVSGGEVHGSILSPGTRVNSWSSVRDSVLLDSVTIARRAQVNRAILDKFVVIEEGATVGLNRELDLERGFTVTPSGITVVPKGTRIGVDAVTPYSLGV
ncbi:glucose-1-phosphate adenylyltransferase [Beutenbergia cavernae DSM 12333]|uniref:Glucose-1-phosphate adenylyltransferase n=1 Tax=Beutenbergia cavernae (strain ATCC BAA-8 / DSM 12333 / CCUG 43141 / JCM 11478 / NBRC 16432 / NCIMB 13614 / HKI 0122) TaxID=471853 RepID=C5BVW8_BEUC1|nr:glucose-1-phosphate adenylyltransferase [Beutenbergia cavernae]ACQ80569.1 glucose-1-phosphate adenylyltransferase [Beutenbergia cavernae DSM 12333]